MLITKIGPISNERYDYHTFYGQNVFSKCALVFEKILILEKPMQKILFHETNNYVIKNNFWRTEVYQVNSETILCIVHSLMSRICASNSRPLFWPRCCSKSRKKASELTSQLNWRLATHCQDDSSSWEEKEKCILTLCFKNHHHKKFGQYLMDF